MVAYMGGTLKISESPYPHQPQCQAAWSDIPPKLAYAGHLWNRYMLRPGYGSITDYSPAAGSNECQCLDTIRFDSQYCPDRDRRAKPETAVVEELTLTTDHAKIWRVCLMITHKCQSEQNRIRSAELATKPEPVERRGLAAL